MSDFWMLILGAAVFVIAAIAIFWPQKPGTRSCESPSIMITPLGPLPLPKPRESSRTPTNGFVGPSGKKYKTEKDVDVEDTFSVKH